MKAITENIAPWRQIRLLAINATTYVTLLLLVWFVELKTCTAENRSAEMVERLQITEII
jgi:hypothetical protein